MSPYQDNLKEYICSVYSSAPSFIVGPLEMTSDRLGDGSLGEVLAVQVREPEFSTPSTHIKSQVCLQAQDCAGISNRRILQAH